jgi:hypothetical protein
MSEYCESCGVFLWPDKPHSCEVAEITRLRAELSAAKEAEATTEEKVRRLVEALVDFRKAKAFLGADDYDNGPEVRGMFQHADAKADLALSEVEALIRTQEEK